MRRSVRRSFNQNQSRSAHRYSTDERSVSSERIKRSRTSDMRGQFDRRLMQRDTSTSGATLEARSDIGILSLFIVFLCFGLLMLFSASMTLALRVDHKQAWYYAGRQLVFSMLGLFIIYIINRRNMRSFASMRTLKMICIVVSILLILVLIPKIGLQVNNQRRWLPLPFGMQFQPSEFAKLGIIFGGGCYYPWLHRQRMKGTLKRFKGYKQVWYDFMLDMGYPLLLVGFWCFLILQQSHFSAALIMVIELFIVFFVADLKSSSWKLLLFLILAVVGLIILIFLIGGQALIDYMKENRRMSHIINRLASFRGESNDTSYQPQQALIAIGSGGLTGIGLGRGIQKYNYLPEAHNDYVFAIICEELGFLGGLLVLILFVAFFLRGLYIAYHAKSVYARIVVTGFSSLITLQALLSMAVNLQVVPATGVSLPFFSYGGTSNVFFMIGIALLLNVSKFNAIAHVDAQLKQSSGTKKRTLIYDATAQDQTEYRPLEDDGVNYSDGNLSGFNPSGGALNDVHWAKSLWSEQNLPESDFLAQDQSMMPSTFDMNDEMDDHTYPRDGGY